MATASKKHAILTAENHCLDAYFLLYMLLKIEWFVTPMFLNGVVCHAYVPKWCGLSRLDVSEFQHFGRTKVTNLLFDPKIRFVVLHGIYSHFLK